MRVLAIVALDVALGGCAFERADVAQKAQASMMTMFTLQNRLELTAVPPNLP
jgi:hypothetical protein